MGNTDREGAEQYLAFLFGESVDITDIPEKERKLATWAAYKALALEIVNLKADITKQSPESVMFDLMLKALLIQSGELKINI